MKSLRNILPFVAIACLGVGCNSTWLGSHGESEGAEEKSDSRPTDKGEGLPGYLVDPERNVSFKIDRAAKQVEVAGAAGAVAGDGVAPQDLVVNVWQVEDAVLEAVEASGQPSTVAATHVIAITPNVDGSFAAVFSYATNAPLVLSVGGDPEGGEVTFLPRPEVTKAPVFVAADFLGGASSLWLSRAELSMLPMSGPAWDALKSAADAPLPAPNVADLNDTANVGALAKAFVYARTGDTKFRDEVRRACRDVIGTETGGTPLTLARKVVGYVIAADIVGLEGDDETAFRAWLVAVRDIELDGRTLVTTHEKRANNWGTHAGASRVAIARYLDDDVDLDRAATVFRGYVGDRASYADFDFGDDLSWHFDPAASVPINPKGSVKEGHTIDGAIVDEMTEAGPFAWPPVATDDHAWNALQGLVVQAELLQRAGYDAWQWEDQALLRAAQFMMSLGGWAPAGDDRWVLNLIDHRHRTSFASDIGSPGKNMGWTGWTHPR